MRTSTIDVPVTFTGMVTVRVPSSVPASRRRPLAHKLALARVLTTTENEDALEADACDEYAEEFDLDEDQAGREWDGCQTDGVSGHWRTSDSKTMYPIDQLISSIHTGLYEWKFFRHGLEDLSDGEARRFDRDLARALRKALDQHIPGRESTRAAGDR